MDAKNRSYVVEGARFHPCGTLGLWLCISLTVRVVGMPLVRGVSWAVRVRQAMRYSQCGGVAGRWLLKELCRAVFWWAARCM